MGKFQEKYKSSCCRLSGTGQRFAAAAVRQQIHADIIGSVLHISDALSRTHVNFHPSGNLQITKLGSQMGPPRLMNPMNAELLGR